MDPPRDKPEDPRPKSFKYHQGAKAEFDASQFDFGYTSFIIDDNYIADPPRIQISIENINDNIDENFLRRELEKAGKIRMLEIVRHRKTRQHLGLAKIEFVTEKEAQACVETFNGKHMMGRQLNVFKDVRFLGLEKIKEDKLNPKPAPIIIKQQQPTPTPIIPPIANTLIPNVTSNGLFTSQQHSHLLPFHPQQLQKSLSSPQTGEYPSPTPSSLTTTPDSTGRPRSLDARIANLMKQSNNPLSAIVGIQPTPALPSFSAFNPKETNYYQTPLLPTTLKTLDHKQRLELNELRGADNNIQSNHLNQKANNNKSDRYDDGDDWNQPTKEVEKLPIKIELTERQIEDEVLPWCYRYFEKEMQTTLLVWLFDKKLKENLGYECIEKNQAAHREKLHAEKIKREQERNDAEVKKRLELRYLNSRNRYNRPAEEVRPKVNVIRQRTNDLSSMQDARRRAPADMRRVNRSSAYVVDERHGSHTTSIDSFSDDEFNRSSSSSSFSGSSSGSSSPSSSSSSSSSFSSSSSVSRSRPASPSTLGSLSDDEEIRVATPRLKPASPEVKTENERDAIEGLLSLQTMTGQNKITDIIDENIIDVKPPVKKAGRKRKKVEELRVVKKQRSSAASPSEAPSSYKENEEELAEKEKYRFEERTALEKRRMLNDLLGTLTEEDIGFLKQVHEKEQSSDNSEVQIPFGSQEANWAHLASKGKPMIESKSESHPKWWRGCSRCDVINKSEKAAIGEALPDDNESKNPKKHTGVIQAATTSSRRDQRGDQRRIAALNPNIDDKLIKMYTTSTLQMRAKNLRFSRSRIHNWGLFACEKIASGDAVIEYVGEKIRPSVADHRENEVYPKMKSHDGSSYFFRVDHDVIDASTKGNKARFINHSCNPNCIAKVIKHDNGSNSIVIYAKQAIKEDEEITYDYKFPREDGENKILCKCGSHNCQKYLN